MKQAPLPPLVDKRLWLLAAISGTGRWQVAVEAQQDRGVQALGFKRYILDNLSPYLPLPGAICWIFVRSHQNIVLFSAAEPV